MSVTTSTSNITCQSYSEQDVRSDYMDCPKLGWCINDGNKCEFLNEMNADGTGVCQLKTEEISGNQPDRRLCFSPNRVTTAIFAVDADLKKEVEEFKAFISQNGWSEYVQIGRFDDERKIFDFKINALQIGLLNAVNIAIYFLDKAFRIDEERSEPYALQVLKEVLAEPED